MNQELIWRHFQNEALEIFKQADGRIRFLARQVRLRWKAGEAVLNVGVGAGLFEQLMMDAQIDIYSLDPDREAIARLNAQRGMNGRARVGSIQAAPFPDSSFSAVVLSEVLEHLNDEELNLTLEEVNRILSPGGLIIGTTPSSEVLAEYRT